VVLLFPAVGLRPALILWFVALAAAPAAARANGDPASDVLLQAKIYFPTQNVSVDAADELHAVVDKANEKGYAIRVALIKDATDLGTVPRLLGKPQQYAEFLGPEIRFAYKGDVLVVMPGGVGLTTTDETEPPTAAIQGMKVEAGGSPDGLAETARRAVTSMAAASGHPIAGKRGGGGSGAVAAIAVALGLVLVGGLAGLWLRRSGATPTAP
jgi:hypothetical protein